MTEKPTPTPEGELIQTALKRAKVSARQAADRAGISEARWRQIANGYQVVSKGVYIPVSGPAETVAAMADAAGVTADQLVGAGRDDAAAELRLLREPSSPPAPVGGDWADEIVGPDAPLFDGETLRWRDEENARIFQLSTRGLSFEAGLAPGSDPADVIDDLRRTLADRVADVSSDLLRRR
ncbi:helix-turn-helix transcriptional regulator [Nocardiopsis sp. NPDC007018]|uniref:helix-turn-helix domain-containing protein n=1 Tax=Nocardiopsis sp. NPDC007018 TaxID=3155721 RepID=UPI0033E3912D